MRKTVILFIGFLLAWTSSMAQSVLEPEADKKGRWGYVDEYGRVVIKHKYDDAFPFEGNVAIVRKGEKFGFIDRTGTLVGKIQYSVIEHYGDKGWYLVAEGGKMIDQKMREKLQRKEEKAEEKRTVGKIKVGFITLLKFKKGGRKTNANDVIAESVDMGGSMRIPWVDAKWGLCDANGNVIIPLEYSKLSDIIDGCIYVAEGDKHGILTETGKVLVKPEYKQIGVFNQMGYCWVSDGGMDKTGQYVADKFGVIDRSGKVVVEPKYDLIGTYFADDESPYRYYAAGAKKILYQPYSKIPDSDCRFLWFSDKNLKAGVADDKGNILIPSDKYLTVYAPTCGMVPLVEKKSFGFYDIQKKSFTPIKGKYTYGAYEYGLSKVNTGGIYYFVDKNQKKVSKQYSTVTEFHDGLCVVGNGGKFGVIDSLGKEVIPLQFQNAKTMFSEGLLGVQKNGKWGFIDQQGEIVFPFEYDNVDDFENGFCTVSVNQKYGCMQHDGKLLLPIEWEDYITPVVMNPEYIWAKRGNKFYCYDVAKGKLAFEKGYDDASNFTDGVAAYVQNGKYGMLNSLGVEFLPARMDNMEMTFDAYAYLLKIEKEIMSDTDYLRFLLFRSGDANRYKIGMGTSVIPAKMWDY